MSYIEQNFEHLDLDFVKYLDCDSNAQTNDEMSDEAIADFCLKKIIEEVEEEMDNLIIVNEEEKNIPTLAEAKLAYILTFSYSRLIESSLYIFLLYNFRFRFIKNKVIHFIRFSFYKNISMRYRTPTLNKR